MKTFLRECAHRLIEWLWSDMDEEEDEPGFVPVVGVTTQDEDGVEAHWVFRAIIEISDETCDLPDCLGEVESVLILVDSEDPRIETGVRICAEHLAEAYADDSAAYVANAQWN